MPKLTDVPTYAEGGFVNDRSGQATAAVRRQLKSTGQKPMPKHAIPASHGRGNPTLRKFQ